MVTYILLGFGMISMIAFLMKRDRKNSIGAIALKSLTSVFFVITAMVSFIHVIAEKDIAGAKDVLPLALFVLGLVFGLLGDIFLDFKIYFKTLNMRFLCLEHDYDILMILGMASFGIGHIFYLTASLLLNPSLWLWFLASFVLGLFTILLVMAIATKVMKMDFRKFFLPSIIYGALLSSFVAFSIVRFIDGTSTGNLILMIGSVFFILSDLVLCMTYFSKAEDYQREGFLHPESKFFIVLNHVTYYAAQYLIAVAILFL